MFHSPVFCLKERVHTMQGLSDTLPWNTII